jgi:hypothetical protein
MSEEWKPVVSYEDYYEVSNMGRVRSLGREHEIPCRWGGTMIRRLPPKILSPIKKTDGYNYVGLWEDGDCKTVAVHRLVLETFIGPCPDGMECCHNNSNKTDNNIRNLRWDTRANNSLDRNEYDGGIRGEKNPGSKLTEKKVLAIRKLYKKTKVKQKDLADLFGVTRESVSLIINGRRWGWLE